mgnify:CR=1 FL=1
MKNINTKTYWDNRFKSGDWNKGGTYQTTQYAKGNVKHMDIDPRFSGSILDFGCALGDAIPILKLSYPNAQLYGVDISEEAIKICNQNYGQLAEFKTGSYEILGQYDIIIASHVMEHLTDDKNIVQSLLTKCKTLYIIVPYKENPLYIEHVNFYEDNYYDDFNVIDKIKYTISYKKKLHWKGILKSFILLSPAFSYKFSKDMILFKIKGSLKD